MQLLKLDQILRNHPYPGRGIVLGRSQDGKNGVIVYFIMGRSENSRNRVFEQTPDGIRTRAFDPGKMTDPSLIIYHPVRQTAQGTIVTNGDQTDTVRELMAQGKSFEEALRTRCYEPDAPNFTPRISGLLLPNGAFKLSILKSCDGDPACNNRYCYEYDAPPCGEGRFLHTYQENLDPLPSFDGEPRRVALAAQSPEALAEEIWSSLNAENKVSLFVRYVELATGAARTVLRNKHQEDAK